MTDKATPRPWSARGLDGSLTVYGDGDKYKVAYYVTDDDAALIVRAVNAHDVLVDALRLFANNKLTNATCASVEVAASRVRNIAAQALRAAGVEP